MEDVRPARPLLRRTLRTARPQDLTMLGRQAVLQECPPMAQTVTLSGRGWPQQPKNLYAYMHDPWTWTRVLKAWGGGVARRGTGGRGDICNIFHNEEF